MKKSSSQGNLKDSISKWSICGRVSKSLPDLTKIETERMCFCNAPFSTKWVYGFNYAVRVISLNRGFQTLIFYAASNLGVFYDWKLNRMQFLFGHENTIFHIDIDEEARWLLTADTGEDDQIMIWSCKDLKPARTVYNPHGTKPLAKVCFTAKYLLTMAYDGAHAEFHWWIWSLGIDKPHAVYIMENVKDKVIQMFFDPSRPEQFFIIVTDAIWVGKREEVEVGEYGKKRVGFDLKLRRVPMNEHVDYGRIVMATYSPVSAQILAGTTKGYCAVFSPSTTYSENKSGISVDKYAFVKAIKLFSYKITYIGTVEDLIVTGNVAGEINFYDPQLRIIYWYQGFKLKAIRGISFNLEATECRPGVCSCAPCKCHKEPNPLVRPTEATLHGNLFVLRQFIVWSDCEGIGLVDVCKSTHKTLVPHRGVRASSVSARCGYCQVAIGYRDGVVELWNFETHRLLVQKDLRKHFTKHYQLEDEFSYEVKPDLVPELKVCTLKYSNSEMHLAAGMENGEVIFLHPKTLDVLQVVRESITPIREICFDPDSRYMALYDKEYSVHVYHFGCSENSSKKGALTWQFIGKIRVHFEQITGLFFIHCNDQYCNPRLFSFGKDNVIFEYNIAKTKNFVLEVQRMNNFDQLEQPLCAFEWPVVDCCCYEEMPAFIYYTNCFKYKIFNYTKMEVLGTYLGPILKDPLDIMVYTRHEDQEYIIFVANNLIGIQKIPLDGNPFKNVYTLGHPKKITSMSYCNSGEMFTVESASSTTFEWFNNFEAVERSAELGGERLQPYFKLLDGGAEGEEFAKIKDLFYYMQILCQGTISPETRKIGDEVSIDSLPDLVRALGFFPTQYEVQNLIREARFRVFYNMPSVTIEFEDFVKLYLNHRPAHGYDFDNIEKAFLNFGRISQNVAVIDRGPFNRMLLHEGEEFSPELARYLLKNVFGEIEEPIEELDLSSTIHTMQRLVQYIPERLTYDDFLDITGLKKKQVLE